MLASVRQKYRGAEKSKYEIAMALCRPRWKSNYESDDADERRFGHRGCVSFDGKRYLRKEYFIGSDWNLNGNTQEVFFNLTSSRISISQSSNLLNFVRLKHFYNFFEWQLKLLSDIFIYIYIKVITYITLW